MKSSTLEQDLRTHVLDVSCWGQVSVASPNWVCVRCACGFAGKLQAGSADGSGTREVGKGGRDPGKGAGGTEGSCRCSGDP